MTEIKKEERNVYTNHEWDNDASTYSIDGKGIQHALFMIAERLEVQNDLLLRLVIKKKA